MSQPQTFETAPAANQRKTNDTPALKIQKPVSAEWKKKTAINCEPKNTVRQMVQMSAVSRFVIAEGSSAESVPV